MFTIVWDTSFTVYVIHFIYYKNNFTFHDLFLSVKKSLWNSITNNNLIIESSLRTLKIHCIVQHYQCSSGNTDTKHFVTFVHLDSTILLRQWIVNANTTTGRLPIRHTSDTGCQCLWPPAKTINSIYWHHVQSTMFNSLKRNTANIKALRSYIYRVNLV